MKMCKANQVALLGIIASTVLSTGCSGGAVDQQALEPVEIEISVEEEAELEEGVLEETMAKMEMEETALVMVPKERLENVAKAFPKEIMEAVKGLTPEERLEKLQEFIASGDYDEATVQLIERMKSAEGLGEKPLKERVSEDTSNTDQ